VIEARISGKLEDVMQQPYAVNRKNLVRLQEWPDDRSSAGCDPSCSTWNKRETDLRR
jgi:hypothetical protein